MILELSLYNVGLGPGIVTISDVFVDLIPGPFARSVLVFPIFDSDV